MSDSNDHKFVCGCCNGEGFICTGVDHTGMQETKECYNCEGKGHRIIKPPKPPKFYENKQA
jgi:transcription elongation factor Elf1